MALLLDEKILAIEDAFARSGIPHAFGGALALAYYATPRGTRDIDVNVFLPIDGAEAPLSVLSSLGVETLVAEQQKRLDDTGQVRVYWEHTPVDLFFSYDALHDACLERVRRVPFGEDARIPILSAEDLVIFKVLFDRPKDQTDVHEVLYAQGPDFERDYCLQWLRRILESGDARLQGFETELERTSSSV